MEQEKKDAKPEAESKKDPNGGAVQSVAEVEKKPVYTCSVQDPEKDVNN